MQFKPQQKIVFIGDSITDCGRRGAAEPFGSGYVSIARALLARYPELGLQFVNKGIGGNTVRDLAARWEQDVVAERPDWLSVMMILVANPLVYQSSRHLVEPSKR